MKDGGPAFPNGHTRSPEGMSLRDWFAGQALAGFCANSDWASEPNKAVAKTSYELADAMLAERSKE